MKGYSVKPEIIKCDKLSFLFTDLFYRSKNILMAECKISQIKPPQQVFTMII